eukprot:gene26393-17487_t
MGAGGSALTGKAVGVLLYSAAGTNRVQAPSSEVAQETVVVQSPVPQARLIPPSVGFAASELPVHPNRHHFSAGYHLAFVNELTTHVEQGDRRGSVSGKKRGYDGRDPASSLPHPKLASKASAGGAPATHVRGGNNRRGPRQGGAEQPEEQGFTSQSMQVTPSATGELRANDSSDPASSLAHPAHVPKEAAGSAPANQILAGDKFLIVNATVAAIEVDAQGNRTALLKPSMYYIDKHPDFAKAARDQGGAKLPHGSNEIDDFLAVWDRVSVCVRLDADGCLQASAPRLLVLHWDARAHNPGVRTSSDLAVLVRNVIPKENMDLQLLLRILSAEGVCIQVVEELVKHGCVVLCNKAQRLRALQVVEELVKHLCVVLCNKAQRLRAQQMQRAVISSSFLTPKGSLCEHLPRLSPELHFQVCSMLGTLCSLDHNCARLLVYTARLLAPLLPNATLFLTSLLQAALPLRVNDPQASFDWWQLPNTPLTQEIAFVQTSSSTQLDTLPSVLVGKPYPSVEAYVDTYMRLHRADCFYDIIREMRKASHGGQYDTPQAPIFKCIAVSGLVIADNVSGVSVRLACQLQEGCSLQFNSLSIGNMVAVSLRGDFMDAGLIWGTVMDGPSAQERAEVLKELQVNYNRARLIENSISSQSCNAVLDTLRTLWAPGCPVELSFSQALLTGKQPPSTDSNEFAVQGTMLALLIGKQQAHTDSDVFSHTCAHTGLTDWEAAAKHRL